MSSDYIQTLLTKPYSGETRSIVIGIDVGTTFSGVAYALLYPGEVPKKINPVTKFSNKEASDNKIPSILYYTKNGVPIAIGQAAATLSNKARHEASSGQWFKVEYFKLHFRPNDHNMRKDVLRPGKLPLGKTAEQVMGDFLRYLVQEAGVYISSAHGVDTWNQVKDEAIIVLGHPNGWTGSCQQRYRTSAVLGGLIPDTDEGHKRMKLVTEGEASALACLSSWRHGSGPDMLKPGFRFMIVDAGGGTVDMTTFEVDETSPLKLKECTAPDCQYAGSVLVNMRAKDLLKRLLANSEYDNEKRIDQLMNKFENTTKKTFDGIDESYDLEIGNRDEDNEELGISDGYLELSREDLAECFRPSVSQTIESILGQYSASHSKKGTVPIWLVGGLGKSKYLLKELQKALEGTEISTPEWALIFGSNAVAKGAVLHHLDHPVKARICRRTYGTSCHTLFGLSLIADHSIREIVEHSESFPVIGPIFAPIVEKGVLIEEEKPFVCSFWKPTLGGNVLRVSGELLCYDGDLPVPFWYEENKDKFKTVGHVEAEIPPIAVQDETDLTLGRQKFDIELKFGKTEVESRIRWEEKGKIKYSPAKCTWLEE